MDIRAARDDDREAIGELLEPIVRAGETFALPHDCSRGEMLDFWFEADHVVFVARDGAELLGTYFIKPNQRGGGAHVANAGYATATHARDRGVARAMCADSLERAAAHGFRAMQFNLVVSTNTSAVHLWGSLGFEVAGRLPGAFHHPVVGDVDAFVMYRRLDAVQLSTPAP